MLIFPLVALDYGSLTRGMLCVGHEFGRGHPSASCVFC